MCEDVPMRTLDALLTELVRAQRATRGHALSIDAVKIDVEGFECEVLRGASTLFTRFRPKLLLVEGKVAATRKCVEEAAARFGYKIAVSSFGRDKNMLLTPS